MIKQEVLNQFLTGKDGIEGWFYPADMLALVAIDNLQASLGISGSICEVGVFKGKSLSFLSHLVRRDLGERLIGFDIFPENTRKEAEANTLLHAAEYDIELVESNTAALTSQRLTPILQTSLRLLHIGAGHDYHEVYHQAILSAPYVHRTDVIVFDDYQDREFPGIEAAVLDFCEIDRPRRFVPFFSGANKIFLCEQSFSSTYQTQLLQFEHIAMECRLSHVHDFQILIGWSKLPQPAEMVLSMIGSRPLYYDLDEAEIARAASQTAQLRDL